jgi:hypothetical protein
MELLHYLITTALLTLVLGWLWKAARAEKAKVEAGRQVFPPTKAARFLLILVAILFAALAVVSVALLHQPGSWWIPYLFLGFVLLVLLGYPSLLTIEVDGVGCRTWFGREKKLRWEDISRLGYNAGNRYFTVRALDGSNITHCGFNADAQAFREEIQRRTRLPVEVAQPGLWKTETVEVSYDQGQSQRKDRS